MSDYKPPGRYVIEFRFPEGGVLYAGPHKGAFGWAPTPETAFTYEQPEQARRTAKNAYGLSAEYSRVMQWRDDGKLIEVENE